MNKYILLSLIISSAVFGAAHESSHTITPAQPECTIPSLADMCRTNIIQNPNFVDQVLPRPGLHVPNDTARTEINALAAMRIKNALLNIMPLQYHRLPNKDSVVIQGGDVIQENFSPDGTTIASIAHDDSMLYLWSTQAGAHLRTLNHGSEITSFCFNQDSTIVVSASPNNIITLWNPHTDAELYNFELNSRKPEIIALSPNGAILATGFRGGKVSLWDVRTGAKLHTLKGDTESPLGLKFSPDGTILASMARENTVRLWNAHTGAQILTLNTGGANFSAYFSPDGKTLALLSNNGTHIYDAHTGTHLSTLPVRYGDSIVFNQDNIIVAAPQTGTKRHTMNIWNATTGAYLYSLKTKENIDYSAFSQDGTILTTHSSYDKIHIWPISFLTYLQSIINKEQTVIDTDEQRLLLLAAEFWLNNEPYPILNTDKGFIKLQDRFPFFKTSGLFKIIDYQHFAALCNCFRRRSAQQTTPSPSSNMASTSSSTAKRERHEISGGDTNKATEAKQARPTCSSSSTLEDDPA